MARRPFKTVLDLGSSNGAFGRWVAGENDVRVIGVDVDPDVFPAKGVEFIRADVLHLPFKEESVDLVTGRAILHHVPDQLERAIAEVARVLKEGSLLISQEPTSDNLVSELARRLVQTELHDPTERPFSSLELERVASRHMNVLELRHHLVFTYLIPHIASRFRGLPKRVLVGLSVLLADVDRRLLAGGEFWKRRAAYVTMSAEKRG